MLHQLYDPLRRSRVLERIRGNLLGDDIESFAEYLSDRISANAIRQYLLAIEHLGAWLRRSRLPLSALDEQQLRSFLSVHLRSCSCPPPASRSVITLRAATRHFLRHLRAAGRISAPKAEATTHVEGAVQAYGRHLVETCGLSLNTRLYRIRYVRRFLHRQFGRGPVEAKKLRPRHVMEFVAECAAACKPGTAKVIVSAVRSYLKYLQLQGLCDSRLVASAPTIPMWKLAHIPKTVSPPDLERFISEFNLASATGRRDYAMALCMVECGLRVCEVAELSLDDVNWREGTLRVPASKTRRERLLPLTSALARAVADYLRRGRPSSSERKLFLRLRGCVGRPVNACIVRGALRRTYDRSGAAPWTGPHALRHTLAARMLQAGARLKEVADVLGHTSIDTAAIYAKVNLSMLRTVALPWPGRMS